jgi:hypothetical protein
MTDTIPRQAVIDAITSKRVYAEALDRDEDYAYNQALDDALAAVDAIPAVYVLQPINGMPKSGKRVYGDRTQPKTLLIAALGE